MELQVGSILEGKVTSITKFGAFVALDNGKSGLVHISEIANTFVNDDVPQPVEIADGSLELAVFFLELKLLELLFADVHHQPFEVAQFAVGVENPLALIPYPFQPPGRE